MKEPIYKPGTTLKSLITDREVKVIDFVRGEYVWEFPDTHSKYRTPCKKFENYKFKIIEEGSEE